ncbi:PRTRC system protein D [Paraburkholderia sp. A1BS-2L]|uniref:PRTRC system protein D n=1 Tax=Paraburkholderia sp. A1BS-2L TaxID=3028373 RepID=UPI003DAA36CC
MHTSVFAVDVGYGNTKWAFRAASGRVVTGMFPSLAPLAPPRLLWGDGESMLAVRQIAKITIGRIDYEVGPGVPLTAAYGRTGRALGDDFVLSDNYAALLFGAICFAGVTRIQRLVLGASMRNFEKDSAVLKQRFVGEHDFGHGRVIVEKVVVIPQPFGSLVLAASCRGDNFRRDDAHLVVDVGCFTTDWVYANGFAMDYNRSGGMPGGTSQIVRRIAKLVSRDEDEEVDEIELIDKALREKSPFFFYGRNVELAPYIELSAPIIADVVMDLQNRIAPLPDVHSIILSGGGIALYAAAIRRAFPRVIIEVIDSPCLANVLGFRMIGEAGLARERRAD